MLNNRNYPEYHYKLSFLEYRFSRAYGDAAKFRIKFFDIDELIANLNITPSDYQSLFPLFLLDVSKQTEKLKISTIDILIKMEFNENVPVGYQAYAVTISDRLVTFQSNGNVFTVLINLCTCRAIQVKLILSPRRMPF